MYRLTWLAGIVGIALLPGCSLFDSGSEPVPVGLAVGDEPIAVQAGAAAMAQGGSAADAAAAMYFALSVTYPVAAGIGGGGICIVSDPTRARVEEVDFLPRDTAHGGAYAIPGSVSGFAYLQSSYGKLPWQRVVAAGEGLASTGFPISHALATRLADNLNVIRLDAGLAAEFLDESGNLRAEGVRVDNPSLAQTLSVIRTGGPAAFYGGSVAEKLIAYSASQDGAISASDLIAYAAEHGAAANVRVGNQIVFLPTRRVGAGAFLSAMLAHLVDGQGNVRAGENLASAVATATKTTLDEFHLASLPRDLGATGFAAADSQGQAVACAVTMNGPFGSGHTAAGTGITLARAPSTGDAGLSAAFLAPAIAQNNSAGTFDGAGAGGPNGTAAIILALLKLSAGIDITVPGQLHATGIEPYETINVIACPDKICAAIPDPAASGLGAASGPGGK
jgi:gamma-glutamyltranspeptidase/glutathione hydrolase